MLFKIKEKLFMNNNNNHSNKKKHSNNIQHNLFAWILPLQLKIIIKIVTIAKHYIHGFPMLF